jgi:putative DNA primase/helicase
VKTVERARGRWREILPQLGIETRFLRDRKGPCPMCGGKTRFRFDDKEDGWFYCNHCGAGPGIVLLRRLHGWNHKTACDAVDRIIGGDPPRPKTKPPPDDWKRRFRNIQRVIDGATDPGVVSTYLTRRGLSVTSAVLRGHPECEYFDEDNRLVGRFPAVIAPIVNPAGVLQSVQRIYDADLEPRKKMMPPVQTVTGAAVRLFELTDKLGIAEGVETALAAYQMFNIPVWSVLCAKGIELFEPPTGIKHLVIFGDNDRSFVGQSCAYGLAERISKTVSVEVRIPPMPDTDWLDFLIGRSP